jgi:hypothetical protein
MTPHSPQEEPMHHTDDGIGNGPETAAPGKNAFHSALSKKQEVLDQPAQQPERPCWSERERRPGFAGYLFVQRECDASQQLLLDLEAHERRNPDLRPVGVIDIRRPRLGEVAAARMMYVTPTIVILRDRREVARGMGPSAVGAFMDALFATPKE